MSGQSQLFFSIHYCGYLLIGGNMGTLGSQEAGIRKVFLSKGLASEESKKNGRVHVYLVGTFPDRLD